MNKFYLSLILSFLSLAAFSQSYVNVKKDSVVVKGELIINNASKTTQGYLYNTGNGVTQFKAITGGDGSSDSIQAGIFYVARKYPGPARAVISNLTLAGVSSIDSAYTAQLSTAKMGSFSHPYPDPYSARNAAMDQVAAGKIPSATVVVLDNQQWYVGSNDSTQNGNYSGSTTSGGVADIQFSETNGFSAVASLAQNKVNYHFGVNAGFYYINSAYPIFAVYVVDGTDAAFESKIEGNGFFKQYFGEAQSMSGGSSRFFQIDNARAVVSFEAEVLWLQQWRNFNVFSYKTILLKARKIIMADADLIMIQPNARNGDGMPSNFTVDFDDVQYSNLLYPVGSNPTDYWYLISTGTDPDVNQNSSAQSSRTKIINLNFGNLFLHNYGEGTLFYMGSGNPSVYCINTVFNCNIKNLHVANHNNDPDNQRIRGLGTGLIFFGWGTTGLVSHTRWNFNIDNYVGNDKLLGNVYLSNNSFAVDNQITLNLKEVTRSAIPENTVSGQNAMFYVNGGFPNTPPTLITVNAGHAKDYIGNVIDVGQSYNQYIFTGVYSTYVSGQATLQFIADNITDYSNVFLKDITLTRNENGDAIIPAYPGVVQVSGSNINLSDLKSANVTIIGGNWSTVPALRSFNP